MVCIGSVTAVFRSIPRVQLISAPWSAQEGKLVRSLYAARRLCIHVRLMSTLRGEVRLLGWVPRMLLSPA